MCAGGEDCVSAVNALYLMPGGSLHDVFICAHWWEHGVASVHMYAARSMSLDCQQSSAVGCRAIFRGGLQQGD